MTTCSVCGKEYDPDKINITEKKSMQKMLANTPKHFMMIGFPDGLKPFLMGNYCSVKCMKNKLKEKKPDK